MDERTPDPPAGEQAPPQPPVPRTWADGTPRYDQEFFLALARLGKSVWNEWREENPDIKVSFVRVDFTKEKGHTFAGFHFGNGTNFKGCRFDNPNPKYPELEPQVVSFAGATFGNKVSFKHSFFGSFAQFSSARFGDDADFSKTVFGAMANFVGTEFGASANFSGSSFAWSANFEGAVLGPNADLSAIEFSLRPRFSHASFGPGANFRGSVFGEDAKFSGTAFGDATNFFGTVFKGSVTFEAASLDKWKQPMGQLAGALPEWAKDEYNKWPISSVFRAISFAGAEFHGSTSFARRTFLSLCDLSDAKFHEPPDFDGCEGTRHLNLYNVKIYFHGRWRGVRFLSWRTRQFAIRGWTTNAVVEMRLRMVRIIAEDAKNHDLERDLYIQERRAERGILFIRQIREIYSEPKGLDKFSAAGGVLTHSLWIIALGLYWLLADYGRSFVRPLAALLVSVPLFWLAYTFVLIPPSSDTPEGKLRTAAFDHAVQAFAISNAVPFVGPLALERDVKLTLLCGDRPIDAQRPQASGQPVCVPIPGRRFQLLALGQSIFSALCIFFAGLALRNYFKLR